MRVSILCILYIVKYQIKACEKDVPKQVELDTPADTQTTTQVVKRHADDLGNNQSTKRQKGETSSTKKSGKVKSTTS